MKRWQAVVLLALVALSGAAVMAFPPGTRVVSQRNGTPTDGIELVFAGDIMLSRAVGDLMAAKGDWFWPFRLIASVTAGADLAFANLESVISDKGATSGCTYCFRADPRAVAGLASAGFDVVSVANNHAWDYGPDAFTDSLHYLAANGISAVGGGRDAQEARGPVVRSVGGVRIAFVAYTDLLPASTGATQDRAGVNLYDPEKMAADITAARAQADVVIVSFHGGEEYQAANDHQRAIYHAAIDAGADLVIGHHPHVVQEVERYRASLPAGRQGWVAYSLGNFVFDQNFSEPTTTGMLLSVTLDGGRITAVRPRTVHISSQYQPSLLP